MTQYRLEPRLRREIQQCYRAGYPIGFICQYYRMSEEAAKEVLKDFFQCIDKQSNKNYLSIKATTEDNHMATSLYIFIDQLTGETVETRDFPRNGAADRHAQELARIKQTNILYQAVGDLKYAEYVPTVTDRFRAFSTAIREIFHEVQDIRSGHSEYNYHGLGIQDSCSNQELLLALMPEYTQTSQFSRVLTPEDWRRVESEVRYWLTLSK